VIITLLFSPQLAQRRNIDPLAPVDHSLIEYDDFAKDFYSEHPSIAGMSDAQVRLPVGAAGVSVRQDPLGEGWAAEIASL
jgi:hypothetical protein